MSLVEHVVVDSGGFIRNAPIQVIGKVAYTIHEVVYEIRDKATRQRLQVLPYELKFKEPSTDAIRCVTDFSKKTGDYKSLSAVDLRVLALVYEIEKENCGTDHIKTVPDRKISWQSTKKPLDNLTEMAGFYIGKKNHQNPTLDPESQENKSDNVGNIDIKFPSSDKEDNKTLHTENTNSTIEVNINNDDTSTTVVELSGSGTTDLRSSSQQNNCTETDNKEEDGVNEDNVIKSPEKKVDFVIEGDVLVDGCLEEGESGESESETSEEDDDDDDDGWITPSNIKQMKEKMGDKNTEKANVKVGCITTDFAMQNVLLQMGLNVISVDGMLIKRAKNYVQRCYGCFKITTDMTREFCQHCGNQTLQRVSMTVEEDGSIKYFLSSRRPITARGKKFSLPMPKGGKHANNPILCEDQREAQQRTNKAFKGKYDVFDPDYVAHSSPFAPIDTHSRAALLGITGKRQGHKSRRNPNENKKVYGRRK